jgi:hypothetical protein
VFILSFAGIEYAIGLILLLIFKEINNSLNFSENQVKNNNNFFKNKNLFLNKYF